MSIAARLWLAATTIIVILAIMTASVFWTLLAVQRITGERRDALQALLQTETVLSVLRDAETGERGFLLTGAERYLEPYQNAVKVLPSALADLKASNGASAELLPRITRLIELAHNKLEQLGQTIEARRNHTFDPAQQTDTLDRGKEIMDEARRVVGEVESIQQVIVTQRDVELRQASDRLLKGLIVGSLIVAGFVVLTIATILRSLARPLAGLTAGIARISAGNFTEEIEVHGSDELSRLARAFNSMTRDLRTERANRQEAQAEVARGDAALKERGEELERRTATIDRLGQMANRMPGCTNEQEFVTVVHRYVPQVFPGVPGALYAMSNSQNLLYRVAEWNDPSGSATEFTPHECWGLRRGQPHIISNASADIVCGHVRGEQPPAYRCMPLVAQGETVGLLYLEESDAGTSVEERFLQVLTETLSSALVNLRLRERLRNQSIRDPLTGLFNRRYMEESLELECARAQRSGHPLSVAMIDLDHFKRFNDTFGHDAGDVILKHFGELLRRLMRQGDIACRFGGEEFVLVLPGISEADARAAAERIRADAQVMETVHRNQSLGNITISIGVAEFLTAGASPDAVISAADQALYAAKRGGRDRVEVFSSLAPPASRPTIVKVR
ncbi:MAG: diguanylate cyclase [Xanthobacteraceae bacterium]|nr:diguanylate cyclase [Xanthobacteraceae bacterium]